MRGVRWSTRLRRELSNFLGPQGPNEGTFEGNRRSSGKYGKFVSSSPMVGVFPSSGWAGNTLPGLSAQELRCLGQKVWSPVN